MLYAPARQRLWDCWLVPAEGRYHLFYIRVSEGGTRWDGISSAVSDDLVHWKEIGTVLEKDPDAVWLGTGMVERLDGRYVMNFSQEKPERHGGVHFAESEDLVHWRRIPGAVSRPDGVHYENDPDRTCDHMPRWDSIGILSALDADRRPPYHAYVTANVPVPDGSQKSGVLGHLVSDDGVSWSCRPPAFADAGAFPSYEVPDPFTIDGRTYVLFCSSSYLGFRFDPRARAQCGGTYYVVADSPEGPFRLPDGDPMLQGQRDHVNVCMNYVGRVVRDGEGGFLYYHIWGDAQANGAFGPVKRLREDGPGKLSLHYYEGNERLKGASQPVRFNDGRFGEARRLGRMPSVEWMPAADRLGFRCAGSSNLWWRSVPYEFGPSRETLSDGRILEFGLRLEAGRGAGIVLGAGDDARYAAFLDYARGKVSFGAVKPGWGSNHVLHPELEQDLPLRYGQRSTVRLLTRGPFLELYVDDRYAGGMRREADLEPDRLGFYAEDAAGTFDSGRLFQMR